MDEKETKSLGVCRRLFNFIMKILTLQALRKATLGCLAGRVSSAALLSDAIHGKDGIKSDPMAQAKLESGKTNNTSKESDSSTSLGSLPQNDQAEDDKESPPTEGGGDAVKAEEEASAQPRAPKNMVSMKKMVSIDDRVEDINKTMKKRKKSKSFDRSNSLENGEDEPKPLKSILKEGSNRDENTEAYVNQDAS